jgi:hypothetical protein
MFCSIGESAGLLRPQRITDLRLQIKAVRDS